MGNLIFFAPGQMLLDQGKDNEMVVHVAVTGEKRNAFRVMVGESEGRAHWADKI
jgi:hypothetical protein